MSSSLFWFISYWPLQFCEFTADFIRTLINFISAVLSYTNINILHEIVSFFFLFILIIYVFTRDKELRTNGL